MMPFVVAGDRPTRAGGEAASTPGEGDGSPLAPTEAMQLGPQAGVVHAAGAADKGLLIGLEAGRVGWLLAPKASGAWYVQCATKSTPLMLVLFSSVSSGLGNTGQSNYSAGNACLDALAQLRQGQGATACSVQWPLVGGAGMGAAAFDAMAARQASVAGMAGISLEQYAACLNSQLSSPHDFARSVQMMHMSHPRELMDDLADASQQRFIELAAEAKLAPAIASPAEAPVALSGVSGALATTLAQLPAAQHRSHTESAVLGVVRELTGAPTDKLTGDAADGSWRRLARGD